jgi:hypothetical protein
VVFSLENASDYGRTIPGLSPDALRSGLHRLRRFWNLLQDLGTEVQDFLSNRVKAPLMAKFVFDTGITCLDSTERCADVAKWQTQRT